MIGPRPVPAAMALIVLTVSLLPGDTRERYREEFRTELCELGRGRQIGQAISLMGGSIALRRALIAREVQLVERHRTSWKCRLGRHSYVGRRDDNDELHAHTVHVCIRCGRFFEPVTDPEIDIDKLARNANYLSGYGL